MGLISLVLSVYEVGKQQKNQRIYYQFQTDRCLIEFPLWFCYNDVLAILRNECIRIVAYIYFLGDGYALYYG